MTAPTLYYRDVTIVHRRRAHLGRWTWRITDGYTGPTLAAGTALTEWRANVKLGRVLERCEKRKPPVITDELMRAVLDRFAIELHEAGPLQLEHLAERAEGRYASGLGVQMRELVDVERAIRRMVAHG